jgi:uncharacterized protein YndB with AHSA1/START domain
MPTFGASLVISAKPDAVWALVGDLTRHPDWSADALEITPVGGDRYTSRANAGGRVFTATIQVLVSEPEKRIEYRVSGESGVYRHRIDLARQGGGTLVTRRVEPERLTPRQRVVAAVALFPVRRPALHRSLERLAEVAPD